ncbi:glycosyltransferase family 4 protein [Seonamhaeicola aphaedonensis]|uniref:Colanic acid/amylovoran biosynthesis glycosyltransferase n=1 Tax=Seonamhaeicola aphaedonensis TaxID=1461338 RepID=A0A3D9HFV0_9FLAO|nr:glycosyltransferase family 4 protein [Seonamhaeicola aphaedonensis]RED48357.1 colanic acid/amylovoran biosynthesis glycosyltransferase [Seonamhaeicola aphaedonensis]
MRIGIVLSETPSYSETFFTSKIKGLQKHGFKVTLFVQHKKDDFNLCEVRVAPKVYKRNLILLLGSGLIVFFRGFLKYNRFLKFIELEREYGRSKKQMLKNLYNNSHLLTADLDWIHFGFATIAIQSEHVAKVIGAKMAVSFRGFDLDVYPLKYTGCYELLWNQVDKVHSISNYLLNTAYNIGLPKSVSYQIITPAICVPEHFKKQDSEKTSAFKIVTVARLHWMKGLQDTLEALAMLKSKQIAFKYIIIGSGIQYENLKYAIFQLGIEDYVILEGQKTHEETMAVLEDSDMYIQYSHSEGFCNAVLEAQGRGLLCITSDGGGLQENIIHGKTGWMVPKRQPKLLAETIINVMNLPVEEKRRMRANAINHVNSNFDVKNQAEQFVTFYSEHTD